MMPRLSMTRPRNGIFGTQAPMPKHTTEAWLIRKREVKREVLLP